MRKRITFCLLFSFLISAIFIIGCGGGSKKKGLVKAIFSVTEKFTAGTAQKERGISKDKLLGGGLGENERVSFTPSSLKIRIRGIYLCPWAEYSESAGGLTCTTSPQIDVTGEATEVNLIGKDALSSLLTFVATPEEAKFGDYRDILLLYGIDVPEGQYGYSEVIVDGEVTVGDTTYTISNLAAPMGTSGIGLNMPAPVRINADSTAVVKVIFDVENAAFLMKNATSPQSKQIPDTDVYVVVDNLVFLPFVGEQNPTIKRYKVVLDTSEFGTQGKLYLKIITFQDADGELVSAGWQTVYLEGFTTGTNWWEPGMLYNSLIKKNEDNTYSIEDNPEVTFTPADRLLKFPAFKLESHNGTLVYGETIYNYTATIIE